MDSGLMANAMAFFSPFSPAAAYADADAGLFADAILTEVMTNNAAAALMFPWAIPCANGGG